MTTNHNSGIVIEREGNLVLNYCIVKNAAIGIESKLDAANLNVSDVDFIACNAAVFIEGKTPAESEDTPPPFKVMNCPITESLYGIYVTLLPKLF